MASKTLYPVVVPHPIVWLSGGSDGRPAWAPNLLSTPRRGLRHVVVGVRHQQQLQDIAGHLCIHAFDLVPVSWRSQRKAPSLRHPDGRTYAGSVVKELSVSSATAVKIMLPSAVPRIRKSGGNAIDLAEIDVVDGGRPDAPASEFNAPRKSASPNRMMAFALCRLLPRWNKRSQCR